MYKTSKLPNNLGMHEPPAGDKLLGLSNATCPKSHYCTFISSDPNSYGDEYACDKCSTVCRIDAGFWHCFLCPVDASYDLCPTCHPKPDVLEIPDTPYCLSDEQRDMLLMVREAVIKETSYSAHPNIAFWRYLVQCNWNAAEATKLAAANATWRTDMKVDNIVKDGFPGLGVVRKCVPIEYHGEDRQGRPLYITRIGKLNIDAFTKAVSEDTYRLFNIHDNETFCELIYGQCRKYNRRIDQINVISDFIDVGVGHRLIVPFLQVSQIDNKAHYPLRVHKLFIINAPWWMDTLFALVKHFLSADIIANMSVHSDSALDVLGQLVDMDQFPNELGGTCQCRGAGNPCMPILDVSDLLSDDAAGGEKGLETVNVAARSTFSKVYPCPAAGGTFAWMAKSVDDYDVEMSVQVVPMDGADAPVPVPAGSPRASDGSETVIGSYLVPPARVTRNEGQYRCTIPCALRFVFNNDYSRFRSKDVKYFVTFCEGPDSSRVSPAQADVAPEGPASAAAGAHE